MSSYEKAELSVVFAVIIAIAGTCIAAIFLDYATGPVNVTLILIVPLLTTGLLCEAYLRRLEDDDLELPEDEPVASSDETEDDDLLDDELLVDELLIHFDDYDDEDLDLDEEKDP